LISGTLEATHCKKGRDKVA